MTKEQQFWNWFKENEAKYFFLNQIKNNVEREKLLEEMLEHLHLYCDGLFFEIGGLPDKKQDLIITAADDIDFFEMVELLVRDAPQLEYWNVIAFKQASDDYGVIEYHNIKLDPRAIFFIPLNNKTSKEIGLRIYIEGYNPARENDFLNVAYLALDNIIGEKAAATNIGYVEIEALSSSIKKRDLIEFIKLPQYIDWKKSRNKS